MTRREEALLSALCATTCLVLLAFALGDADMFWIGGWYSLAAIAVAGCARLVVDRRSIALSLATGVVVSLGAVYVVLSVVIAPNILRHS